jgi:formylglycine-generating enzyme required for sulfatase activity
MTGNVWEWTGSRYMDYPCQNDTRRDPEGEARRTLRGGAWYNDARFARASCRSVDHPGGFSVGVGLRVAVAPVLLPSGS